MKIKPVLLVIITLVIGLVLGMLTSAQLRFHRLKPVRVYFSDDRFREGFYKTIQPGEKQKEEIEQILDKYARINGETQTKFRREMDSILRSFRKELDSKLTKEQLARVKEMDEKRQEMIRIERNRYKNDNVNFRSHRRHSSDRPHHIPEPRMDDGPPQPPPGQSEFPVPDTSASSSN